MLILTITAFIQRLISMLVNRLRLLMLVVCLASPASAEVIVTRDAIFYIPFTASNNLADQQLSLFVSGDRGASWQFYQRQPVKAGRFSFRAGVDGDFWFSVRPSSEADGTGQATFDQPELQVAIDRQQPRLTLLGKQAPEGQIVCQWTAEDPHLDVASLQLQFRFSGQTNWSQATIDSQSVQTDDAIFTGSAVLPIPAGVSVIHLRADVKDRAGNLATVERDLDRSSLPLADPADLANFRLSPSVPSPGPAPDSDRAAIATPVVRDSRPFKLPRADGGSQMAVGASQQAESPANDTYGWRGGSPAPSATHPAEPDEALGELPLVGVVPVKTNPMIANYPSTAAPHVLAQTSQRVSNSRRFEIEYGVDAVGTDQIHRVEVWYTSDGGHSWRHHGDDEDLVSPYLMEVTKDGMFGVRLMVQTRSRFTIRPPASGDPADVWIRVDATPPAARITSVRYGTGENAGTLELYWEARDENLAERPVLFLYSDGPQGPWRKVADALANTGRYDWAVDDRAPAQIYLRLEVRDKAGNLTEETLPMPINNQRVAPRGHIRDVRPAALQLPNTLGAR